MSNNIKIKLKIMDLTIKDLSIILGIRAYNCGQKINKSYFNTHEINKMLKLFNCKYEDLFNLEEEKSFVKNYKAI